MPYYLYIFELAGTPEFADPQFGYPSFLGRFIRPIVQPRPDLLYYFQRVGSGVQFCFVADNGAAILQDIQDRAADLHVGVIRPPAPNQDTLVGHFGSPGSRFLAANHSQLTNPQQRAQLVLTFLKAVCVLLLDNLVDQGNNQWSFEFNLGETNDNGVIKRENPLGNNFESLAHLLSNITGFQFDVTISAHGQVSTPWMHPTQAFANTFRCRI